MLKEGIGVKSASIYDEQNLDLVRNSEAVLLMEDKSLVYKISMFCERKTHFYHLASDSFQWLPTSFVIGGSCND